MGENERFSSKVWKVFLGITPIGFFSRVVSNNLRNYGRCRRPHFFRWIELLLLGNVCGEIQR